MADYKQTTIAGQRWNRFSRVVIDNPRPGAPSVTCIEQEVIAMAGGEVSRDIGNLSFPFDPAEVFEIIDPTTNVGTGQKATGAQVYALVYSFVMGQARKRDEAIVAAAKAAADAAAAAAAIAAAAAAHPTTP